MSIDLDIAGAIAAAQLSDEALAHSERVADTSADLACIYGVDVGEAMLAGLLHDWHRDLSEEDLIGAAVLYGIELTDADRVVPYLLHARTGARAVADVFPGIADGVVSAVAVHTLGTCEMSPLDMVVYVADMIEPARAFKGVDDLREATGSLSLQELFALAYQHTVLHVIRSGGPLHPSTVDVWNAHCVRGRP